MRKKHLQLLLLGLLIPALSPVRSAAQDKGAEITTPPEDGRTIPAFVTTRTHLKAASRSAEPRYAETADIDTTHHSVLKELMSDDPTYNQKLPWYIPAAKILISNAVLLATDRYVFNYDFSHVGFNSWSNNLKGGWEWDNDRFGVNFFFHPYTGGGYFMTARSSGYNYFESIPFAMGGSILWEYFGETTKPSYNDLVNTTFNGAFLGEVAYRLTSNILDDRATGADRAWREIAAGVLSPARLLSRVMDGKAFRVTNSEVYEKEPMDARISVGMNKPNVGTQFGTGPGKFLANVSLEYGDPFADRPRQPFDHFKLLAELSNAYGRKLLDNVTGYGYLAGSNVQVGPFQTLMGLFQHFDYFDNNSFELGDIAIGGGILSKLPISRYHSLYSNWHLSVIPLAGNNTRYGPIDTTQTRDYNYGDGLQAMNETGFTISDNLLNVGIAASYIIFHSYVGQPGNNYIGILRPRIALNVFHNIGLAVEDQIYYSNRTSSTFRGVNLKSSEQRFMVQWTFDDFPKE